MITVSSTDIQNNFEKYLRLVQNGEEVIILSKDKAIARLISHDKSISFDRFSCRTLKNDYEG